MKTSLTVLQCSLPSKFVPRVVLQETRVREECGLCNKTELARLGHGSNAAC